MITADVTVYPLKTSSATNVINNSINSIKNNGVNYQVDSMKTRITGSKEQVFSSLNTMFSEAERTGGEVSMVVNITNSVK
ncbi:YkoF family thiamine/hydroxymethylpyrimidine-binding protein [Thermohalobacter berrensis]|uniref:Thiamin/hydroxymethyl pyrimidine-binding YkoF putative domain-containing protein n=1 Tax=Thermohalobacter berrensis TaxID=99594 RepID=A0A419T5C5_9FIRM|nr:YkoF family thiamine/hydroxymethylpyrimidine-binding protein [Thermohalobacter berrensis]RKD32767.1 hypothetical protein BET03_10570 [Thermohalobacter berrensis]